MIADLETATRLLRTEDPDLLDVIDLLVEAMDALAESIDPRDHARWVAGQCVHCGKNPTRQGHDPCIADLPGVVFACCGHGAGENGERNCCYIVFRDGPTLYGHAAYAAMQMLDGDPPAIPTAANRLDYVTVEQDTNQREAERAASRVS